MSTYKFFWRVTTVVVFGCMFMSPVAHSQSRLQYSFVDVAYSQADVDDPGGGVGDLDADIISVSGSIAITDELFIQAGYDKTDVDDVFGISLEADDIFLGIGWHNALTENTDFVFDVNYLYVDAELCAVAAAPPPPPPPSAAAYAQQAYIKASNPDVPSTFGQRVALSGDTLVVGAPTEDSGVFCISDDDDGYGLDLGVRSLINNDKVELAGGVGYADIGDDSGDFVVAGSARYHFTNAMSGAIGAAFSDDVTQYGVNLRFAW